MRRHFEPPDKRQYGSRSSDEVRGTLLRLTRDFVLAARRLHSVTRIAMLGSLLTDKARPHDADVLVSIGDGVDFEGLATLARRLKGQAQGINSGADLFLADTTGTYVGRICHYRECHPRALCRAALRPPPTPERRPRRPDAPADADRHATTDSAPGDHHGRARPGGRRRTATRANPSGRCAASR
jgi:hypothetical protein